MLTAPAFFEEKEATTLLSNQAQACIDEKFALNLVEGMRDPDKFNAILEAGRARALEGGETRAFPPDPFYGPKEGLPPMVVITGTQEALQRF